MRRFAGFTLIELLVALFITAIMFTIGYRALEQALRSRKELQEQSARLIAVQQALRTIEQDFELLQPRPVRQLTGDGYLPALMSSPNAATLGGTSTTLGGASFTTTGTTQVFSASTGTMGSSSTGSSGSTSPTLGSITSLNGTAPPLVTFTRGSWTNPAGLPRPELQRVSYSIENGTLMRSYTVELDSTLSDVPIKRKLIDRVKSFSMRFMDAGHQWQTQWPESQPGASQQGLMLRMRPVAVEVTIELEDWGVLMRHIEVAG